jgi:ribosomal protein L40E
MLKRNTVSSQTQRRTHQPMFLNLRICSQCGARFVSPPRSTATFCSARCGTSHVGQHRADFNTGRALTVERRLPTSPAIVASQFRRYLAGRKGQGIASSGMSRIAERCYTELLTERAE